MARVRDESSSLGELLRRYRMEAGLTQEELAERAQVSVRSIGDLERGLQRAPHRDTVRRLGRALQLGPDEQTAFEAARPPRTGSLADAPGQAAEDQAAPGAGASRPPGRFASWLGRTAMRVRYPWPIVVVISACVATAVVIVAIARTGVASKPRSLTSAFGRLVAIYPLPATVDAVLSRPAGFAVTSQGDMYVLDAGAGRIWRLAADGTPLGSWGSAGGAPGQMLDPSGLAVDAHGDVYVCDTANNRVEKFSATGALIAAWGSPNGGSGRFYSPDGVTVGRDGLIFADAGHNRIQVLDASGPTRTNDPNFYTQVERPVGLAADSNGDLFVADSALNQISQFTPTGFSHIAQWPGSGDPTWLALDGKGDVYVTDPSAREVTEYATTSGTVLRAWHANTPGSMFKTPAAIATAPNGAIFILDSGRGRIMRLTRAGRWSVVGPERSASPRGNSPQAIAVDGGGNLYAVDRDRILQRAASGSWSVYWQARGSAGLPYIGPIGGIASDLQGNVYFTDFGSGNLLRLSGTPASPEVWGQNATGRLSWHPEGVAIGRNGHVYVTGQQSAALLELTGAGQLSRSESIDSSAPIAGLAPYPHGVAVDPRGFAYITDELNDRVLKYSPGGALVASWGSPGSGPKQFRAPEGLAVDDRSSVVYVADTGNNRVDVLSEDGTPLGSRAFARPTDVAFDPRTGRLWVSESALRQIKVYATGRSI
jgi:tripartite motif-containing protein 71